MGMASRLHRERFEGAYHQAIHGARDEHHPTRVTWNSMLLNLYLSPTKIWHGLQHAVRAYGIRGDWEKNRKLKG
jgi:hypothetical protein